MPNWQADRYSLRSSSSRSAVRTALFGFSRCSSSSRPRRVRTSANSDATKNPLSRIRTKTASRSRTLIRAAPSDRRLRASRYFEVGQRRSPTPASLSPGRRLPMRVPPAPTALAGPARRTRRRCRRRDHALAHVLRRQAGLEAGRARGEPEVAGPRHQRLGAARGHGRERQRGVDPSKVAIIDESLQRSTKILLIIHRDPERVVRCEARRPSTAGRRRRARPGRAGGGQSYGRRAGPGDGCG